MPDGSDLSATATPVVAATSNRASIDIDESEANEVPRAGNDAPTQPARSWSEFTDQLGSIQNRIEHVRRCRDPRLAKQVFTELHTCAKLWLGRIQRCMEGGATEHDPLAIGEDGTGLEIRLAQFETTLTNLHSMDWSATIDDILNQLEKEALVLSRIA